MKVKLLRKIRKRVVIVKHKNVYVVVDLKAVGRLGGITEPQYASEFVTLEDARILRIDYIQKNIYNLYNDFKPFYKLKKSKEVKLEIVN